MKYFSYNLKEHEVYMIEDRKAVRFFRRANDSADYRELTAELAVQLRPIAESKKMKENGWESKYYWELPYDDSYHFKVWLEETFNGNRHHFEVKPYIGASIRLHTYSTHNEVNEPYLIVSAALPKDVLRQICDMIMRDYLDLAL